MTLQTTTPLPQLTTKTAPRRVRGLVHELDEGRISVETPYQRPSVWTVEQQRNLVRSFLIGLPVPALILNDRYAAGAAEAGGVEWAVIDGRQRLEAMQAWFTGNLAIPASWLAPKWVATTQDTEDGPYVTMNDLTRGALAHMGQDFIIGVVEAQVDSIAAEADIFLLVNGAGVAQDAATLDRAAKIAEGSWPA